MRKQSVTSSNSELIIREILKLNVNEAKYLNFDLDGFSAAHAYLNTSMTLDFEENDMLEDYLEEIMSMHCKDNDKNKSKRINFKIKLNCLNENKVYVINYAH